MSEASGQTGRAAGGRWLRVALAVSVGLNLLVAGFVVGALIDDRDGGRRPHVSDVARDLGLGPYAAALPRADRHAVGRAVRDRIAAEGGLRAYRSDLRQSFAGVVEALRAEPFDPAALSALLARQVEGAEARRRLGQEAFVAHLAQLTPAERSAVADRLEQALAARRAFSSRHD